MARHHAFWVILAGAVPTAFRSPRREDLLPTLHQLQRTQQDVSLRWFDRGQLWESPEAARFALIERRRQTSGRNSDWRPGGAHKDPRARYQLTRDQKRARFKHRQRRDFDAKPEPTPGAPESQGNRPPFDRDRQQDRWRKPQGSRPFKPQGDRPRDDRPHGDRWGGNQQSQRGPAHGRPPFRDRRDRPFGDRPFGDRPFKPKGGGRPPGQFDRASDSRPPGKFGNRPPGKFGRPPGGGFGKPSGSGFGRPPGKFGGGRPPGKFGSGRPPGKFSEGRPPGKFGDRPPGKFGRPPGKFGRPPGKFGRPPGKFGRPPGKFGGPRGRGPKPKK